jgi:branched-chain amino acid transport system permease protein
LSVIKKLTMKRWLLLALIIVLCLTPLFVKNPYILDLMLWMFFFSILTMSVYQIGVVNRLLFGSGAFVGIGAYTSTLLTMNLGMSFWPSMILGGVVAATIAFILGIPLLRIPGIYFAIVTWSLGEILEAIYRESPSFGQSHGLKPIPPPEISGTPFTGTVPYYYLALILMLIALVFYYRLRQSRFGQDLRSIGLSDTLASSLGINVVRHRLICFVMVCFFLGMSGAFYAAYQGIILPYFFGISFSIQVMAFLVVGGFGSLWGGIIGSITMTLVPDWLHAYEYLRPLLYGVVIMVTMVIIPRGLISLPHQARLWRRGKLRE